MSSVTLDIMRGNSSVVDDLSRSVIEKSGSIGLCVFVTDIMMNVTIVHTYQCKLSEGNESILGRLSACVGSHYRVNDESAECGNREQNPVKLISD